MPADPTRWEHFHHMADIGVRGVGPSLEAAFEQAAVALTAVITDPACVAAREAVDVACEAPDDEVLFAEWLNALVFEMATRRMLFSRFEVHLRPHASGRTLQGRAWGEPIDARRHHPAVEVKGATYTALRVGRVEPNDGAWVAEVVVDV